MATLSEADKQQLLGNLNSLRMMAESSGIIEEDPWAELDAAWTGPDVDLASVEIVTREIMVEVRNAWVEGRIEQSIVLKILDITEQMLPLLMAAMA